MNLSFFPVFMWILRGIVYKVRWNLLSAITFLYAWIKGGMCDWIFTGSSVRYGMMEDT
jgi:hypothetical protein